MLTIQTSSQLQFRPPSLTSALKVSGNVLSSRGSSGVESASWSMGNILKKIKQSLCFTTPDYSERTSTSKRIGPGTVKLRCHRDCDSFIICAIWIKKCHYTRIEFTQVFMKFHQYSMLNKEMVIIFRELSDRPS